MTTLTADDVVHVDPEIMGGTPVFRGTRVPVEFLFDVLIGGETVAQFLEDYPTVTAEQVESVLDLACARLLNNVAHPPR